MYIYEYIHACACVCVYEGDWGLAVLEHKLQDLEKDLMQMFTKEETMRRIKIARHEAHKQAVKKVNSELCLDMCVDMCVDSV